MFRLSLKGAPIGACLLQFVSATFAATTTSISKVHTIATSCTINSASALNFGSQGLLAANVDQTSTLQVQCSNTTPYNIGLDQGQGAGATVTKRQMTSGANTVAYSDSGRTTVWGNAVGTNTVAATGTGAAQTCTIYGRVPPQITPPPGTYADAVTVTMPNYHSGGTHAINCR